MAVCSARLLECSSSAHQTFIKAARRDFLLDSVENTTPHFICCIEPNDFQSPGRYDQQLVLQQLCCCGVLEVIRISRSGFPTRMSHQKFARRYGFLLLDHVSSQDPLSVSVAILHQFKILPEMYQVGYTKLFF